MYQSGVTCRSGLLFTVGRESGQCIRMESHVWVDCGLRLAGKQDNVSEWSDMYEWTVVDGWGPTVNSPLIHVTPLWYIILIPGQPLTTVHSYMSLHSDTLSWFPAIRKQQSTHTCDSILIHYPDSRPTVNNSPLIHVTPLWYIILIPGQPLTTVHSYMSLHSDTLSCFPANRKQQSTHTCDSILIHYPDSRPTVNNSPLLHVTPSWYITLIPAKP
jgi:hypothetical protein